MLTAELPEEASGVLYSIGFVIATGLLHALGIAIGLVLGGQSGEWHFAWQELSFLWAVFSSYGRQLQGETHEHTRQRIEIVLDDNYLRADCSARGPGSSHEHRVRSILRRIDAFTHPP